MTDRLAGNCLQRLTFDQAEQSEATEDGFQRIREVTGLTDVMDIVHKLLGNQQKRLPPHGDRKSPIHGVVGPLINDLNTL